MGTPDPACVMMIMDDLKVENVTVHSLGKSQTGKLHLHGHHLIFVGISDVQSGASNKTSQASSRQRFGSSSSQALSRNGRSLDGDFIRASTDSDSRQSTTAPKARPKEIWIPYPMINHCVLRLSNSHARVLDYSAHLGNGSVEFEDGATFPPVYGTNSYRQSTDSTMLPPVRLPQMGVSPSQSTSNIGFESAGSPAIRIRKRDFQMLAFHFHPSVVDKSPDDIARDVFYRLRSRCCLDRTQDIYAFHFRAPKEEIDVGPVRYDARREFARMGISEKAAEGPGSSWRITDINREYKYSSTYPRTLCEPHSVSDNTLKYGGTFRSKSRIPSLTYLHPNGGSICRASQPMVGIQNKRNPQDERLVSAIFTSHTTRQHPPSDSPPQPATAEPASLWTSSEVPEFLDSQSETALDEEQADHEPTPGPRIYGSTRRNLIVDARPRVNALANRATGGGIEDVSNYCGPSGTSIERVFLDIANIHVMRKSLDKVIDSFANSDYLNIKPNQELLRNSGWLTHIAGLIDGAELVARVVGLGGSHVLLHCSDGWDRTSQVAGLAEVMLDPHYRSLDGFITLVQKDFLSFGHKFNDRHGILGSEKWFEIENERVTPARSKETWPPDSPAMNSFSSKALTGAKTWFEKGRTNFFRPQNESSREAVGSRAPSPPPNPVLHSLPITTATSKEDRCHKTDTKEIAPIFHQFLDAVFQLQYQFPSAFEFNERFLKRLFYHAYAGQYGEFMFNTEKDRAENEDGFASVWPHFLSRRSEFTNPGYVPKIDDPLLFAQRQGLNRKVEVRWWASLFARKDEDMNTPHALAPPDPEKFDVGQSQPSLEHDETDDETLIQYISQAEPMQMSLHSIQPGHRNDAEDRMIPKTRIMPILDSIGSSDILSSTSRQPKPQEYQQQTGKHEIPERSEKIVSMEIEEQGDPLGVSGNSRTADASRQQLNIATLASGSVYSDR